MGSRLYWKSESFVHTPLFAGQFFEDTTMSPRFRVEHWELDITLPAGKALYVEKRGIEGGLESRTVDGDYYRFTYEHPTSRSTRRGRLFRKTTMLIYCAYRRFRMYWPSVALYHANAAPKAVVTDSIRALAQKLTIRLTGDREKARALYDWVSANIRYVGVYLGNGGYVPHSADEVLANEYGDCKDHTALLEALLAAAGIDSVPALINADTSYTLPKVGSFAFNHVITYLPSLDLYVDSTARFAPFGILPFADADKPVALTSRHRLGRTPRMRADVNVTRTKEAMVIHSDGTINGTSMATESGTYEISSRSWRFSDRASPENQVVKGLLSRFGETGSGSISYVDPEDIEKPYWIEGRFQLDPVANIPGRGAMRIPVGLAPGRLAGIASNKTTVSEHQQSWPCTSLTLNESYTIQFPSNVRITSIPDGVAYRDDQITFQSTYRRVGGKCSSSETSSYSVPLRCAPQKI